MADTPKPTLPAAPAAPALPPAPEGHINVFVDGNLIIVKKGSTVMDACKQAEKEIPHFCFHKRLSIAGNCRMCMVEIEGMPKPVASCHWPAAEGMKVRTNSQVATDARKGTMEFLLINHPLDCPICDQGGECTLQDLSVAYGSDRTHFNEMKRAVDDKNIGSKIKTVMTRCIHCTRCIRFATEIAGVEEMGATGRGESMQVGTYVEQALQSELAGNMIDLCPVGALTSKPFAYQARPWELEAHQGIDVTDATGTHIRIDTRAGKVMRIVPRERDDINEEWMTDAGRYSYDALAHNRLTTPLVRKGKSLENSNWNDAFATLAPLFKKAQRTKVAGLMSDMHGAEDAFAFRAFLKDILHTDNMDCRTDGSVIDGAIHAANIFNTPLKRFEEADAVLLIGCNPRLEAPLVNVRLRRAARKRRVPVAAVAAPMDLTYAYQALENSPKTLEQLLDGKHPFAATLKAAQKPLIIVGAGVYTRPDAQAVLFHAGLLASKYAVKKGWNGFNVLHHTAGRITALDMGVYPTTGGMDTAEIVDAWNSGKLEALIVYGDGHLTAKQLKKGQSNKGCTLVYIGTHRTEIAEMADVVLPSAAWSEKSGLYANVEGRVQLAPAATQPPLSAKEDWKIFRALSAEIADALPFDTLTQLREKIADFCPSYAPENIGHILPAEWQEVGKAKGKLTAEPFTNAVKHYYLRTDYLRQSALMQHMQAETGTAATKKKVA